MNNNLYLEQLENLIGDKFGKYSKYVIQERALPDLRDGLKPVQRRILYAMYQLKLFNNSSYKKSARVVGDVIGKYHPHGDTSVYEAMVRMAQDWKLNLPLIDMHGNKGSIDGDSAAAMRYTEARLSKISEFLISNIEKGLTPFSPNFDDSELEPTVFPSLFPNLLVNGATGIAAGYATNIPPHNLQEVIKAIIYVLKNESITLSEITKIIKGPDFPTGGTIYSKDSIKESYAKGKGKITIRATLEYIEKENEIHITEIPFEVNKSDLVKKIDEIIRSGKIPFLTEVRDDSDRKGLQITLLCKKQINLTAVTNYLFKHTDLQKNYFINMVSIRDKKPQLLGILDILDAFKSFSIEVYTKLFQYELAKLLKRFEIVEGLIKAVSAIDKVIKLIRQSKNRTDAKEKLILEFDLTDNQATAIVDLRLYRLSSTDILDLEQEIVNLNKSIKHYKKGLNDRNYLIENIISKLEELMSSFKTPRRTKIDDEVLETLVVDEKSLLQEEQVNVVLTSHGYIKRVSLKSKDSSNNEPTGKLDNDNVIFSTQMLNLDTISIFTDKGKYFSIPVYKLEEFKWKDKGCHIGQYFSVGGNEKITSVIIENDFSKYSNSYLIVATKNGLIKRMHISELNSEYSKKGSKFIGLKDDDEVIEVLVACNENYSIFSITKNSRIIKYDMNEIPLSLASASGVKNISLDDNDEIISVLALNNNNIENTHLNLFTDSSWAKRFKAEDIKISSRAAKGISLIKDSKTSPKKVIKLITSENMKDIIMIDENDKITQIDDKYLIPLSSLDEGLNKISNVKINQIICLLNIELKSKCNISKQKFVEKKDSTNLKEFSSIVESKSNENSETTREQKIKQSKLNFDIDDLF